MDNIAVPAGLLAIIGIAIGLVLAPLYILAVSVGLVSLFGFLVWKESLQAPGGTSGAMGLTFLVFGALACLLIPAWIACWLK